jgi:CMP-N-acetylneuraminic acid synthetase
MYNDFSLLALIPARGGSKGLPNKNILECAGKPLIEWSIAAAKNANFIDDVLVSTDSKAIAAVSKLAGASVPFLRPNELTTDDSSMLEAVKHAWENCVNAKGEHFDYVVLLQPTSPLRTAAYISDAIKFYFSNRQSDDDTLASVYQVSQKHGWLMQIADESRYIRFCLDVSSKNPQRQKLKPYYLPNGAIFIIRGGALGDGLYSKNTLPFVMADLDSIDIDTLDDFQEAEARLIRRLGGAIQTNIKASQKAPLI